MLFHIKTNIISSFLNDKRNHISYFNNWNWFYEFYTLKSMDSETPTLKSIASNLNYQTVILVTKSI